MEYDALLERALKQMPEKGEEKTRFVPPKLISEIQGNRTYVKNFVEAVKLIRRDPKHVAKFLFKELAAPGNIDGKQLVLQRKLTNSLLNQRFEDYLKRFVFCHECGKPDTKLLKEDRFYILNCEACGARKAVA